VPQVEVTFDIDANGILHVSARDKDTGAEQKVTISETSNLDQSEIQRMVSDAEAHRSEDAALRERVNARNELDSVAYQVERSLKELGDAVPEHERARAEILLNDARTAVKEDSPPIERLRSLTAELHQLNQSLAASARSSASTQPPSGSRSGDGDGQGSRDDADDVIDAEFTSN
jgi:molecular chaperone DnaK